MAKHAKDNQPPAEKALDEALRVAGEHLRTLLLTGRWGHAQIVVEAGRITFIDRFEREKVG